MRPTRMLHSSEENMLISVFDALCREKNAEVVSFTKIKIKLVIKLRYIVPD